MTARETLGVGIRDPIRNRLRGRWPTGGTKRGTGMSRHEREDDQRKYEGNGHDPNRPVPQKDPSGKHGRPDTDEDEDPKR